MSLTISSSRLAFHQSPPHPRFKNEAVLPSQSSNATSVELSDEAQTLLRQEQTVKNPQLSNAELKALYHRVEGPDPWSRQLDREMNAQGKNAPSLLELPNSSDPDRLALAKQAATFVYSFHMRGHAESPYKGLSREALNEIIFDESGEHTGVERRAARLTRNGNDEAFFMKLNAQPDQRVIFQGAIDYFDSLSPVEQSIYPDGHRETRQRLLEQEEAQSGTLRPDFNLWELFMDKPPRNDVLFPNLNRPRSAISASPSAPPPSQPLPPSS